MKNKIISIIAIMMTLVFVSTSLISCSSCKNKGNGSTPSTTPSTPPSGSDSVSPPEFDFMGTDLSTIVTLGQYKGYVIEVEAKPELTDELLWTQINRELINYGEYVEVKDRAVLESDVIKIKYEGYNEAGEKFEGGTGDKDFFTVYNGGEFIEGFAEGLIGAEIGVQTDVNVTFPEDYHAEDLAGKPATFKVTVECIYEAKEVTDELVSTMSNGKMKTAEEFIDTFKKTFQDQIDLNYDTAKLTATWLKILDAAKEVALPESVVEEYYNYTLSYYSDMATQYWMTLDTFLEYIDFSKEDIRKQARDEFFYEVVLYSIIKAENISLSDEEFKTMLDEMIESNNTTEENIYKYYTKEALAEMFLCTKAYESVLEWNTYVDKAPESDNTTEENNG